MLFSLSLRTTLSQVSRLFPVDKNPAHEHRSTLADCTVLAQIRDCCDDLETCLLSSLGWTKPQRQDKTLETLKWSRSRTVGRQVFIRIEPKKDPKPC